MKKKYNSIEEVNRELKILNVERELAFHKVMQSFENLKEGVTPYKVLMGTVSTLSSAITRSNGFRTLLFTTILNIFFKKRKK